MISEVTVSVPPKMADETFFLFARAADRVLKATDRLLAPFEICHRHYSVLLLIADDEEWSQTRLAKTMGLQKTRMVALIDMLESKGLIQREPNANDRREYKVILTETGKRTVKEIRSSFNKQRPSYLRELSGAETQEINRLLGRTIGPAVCQNDL
ncbi:MAG: hypothetical protein DMG65_20560 [Candidatus Angelobacter sp. Gp1-AA117]|nr:MAG: hypothetical protein DMG65_20560 [Candidatus Angelobacter sp. Gp1-AA117]